MTLSSDWQIGKCFEWCIELPFINRPRKSPVFLIQDTECYLLFEKKFSDKNYYLYLKPETTCNNLKSFPLIIYSALYNDVSSTFHRSCVNFHDANKYICLIYESSFAQRLLNLISGPFIRFCFVFQNGGGSSSLLEKKKRDEKSTQANLMLSLQTDVEYLSLDFGELLRNGDHSDVQLLCNGGNIPAHRAVLAARSKTFSDMFRDNTEESKRGLINFTATEKSMMELCLEFIYKGKILNLPVEKASNLYVLGQVLKIESLKTKCSDLMIHSLSEDNYISYLILADKYDDEYFKSSFTDFLSDHVQLLKSESWIKFSEEHMKTALYVYRKCMLKFI